MPIIYRGSGEPKPDDLAADTNRRDIGSVDTPTYARDVASAVCAFVEPKHIKLEKNVRRLNTTNATVLSERVNKELAHEIKTKLANLRNAIRRCIADVLQASDAAAEVLNRTESLRLKEIWTAVYSKEEVYLKDLTEPFDRLLKSLENLNNSPDLKVTLKMADQFLKQRSFVQGTGFRINNGHVGATSTEFSGYVMTAAHLLQSLPDETQWTLFFNLHFTRPIRGMDGGLDKDLRHDSAHTITRVILCTDPGLNINKGQDVAIVSTRNLSSIPLPVRAQTKLELAKDLPQWPDNKNSPLLYLLGHPHGLSLKYSSAPTGGPKPHIIGRPAPDAPRQRHPTIAAYIDTFRGNSGGPLLVEPRADLSEEDTKVIGMVRGGRAPGGLWSSIHYVLVKFAQDLKVPPDKVAAFIANRFDIVTSRFGHLNLADFQVWPPPIRTPQTQFQVTWEWYKQDDPRLENAVRFNRVDLYEPFVNPVQNFLSTNSRVPNPTQRSVCIDLEVVVQSKASKAGLVQPELVMESGATSFFGKESPVRIQDPSITLGGSTRFTYRWRRMFRSLQELHQPRPSVFPPGNAYIPGDALMEEGGLCAWRSCEIRLQDPDDWIPEAKLGVYYCYDTGSPTDTSCFGFDPLVFLHDYRAPGAPLNPLLRTAIFGRHKDPRLGPEHFNVWNAPVQARMPGRDEEIDELRELLRP